MRTSNYLEKLDLGEEGGVKHVLVRDRLQPNATAPDQKPWAPLSDTAKILRVRIPTLYVWIYKNGLTNRRFKKRETDRTGITLIPIMDAVEFAENRKTRRRYVPLFAKETLANLTNISVGKLANLILDLHAIIEKQAAMIGEWPTVALAKAYRQLNDEWLVANQGNIREGKHEQTNY